MWTIDWGPVAIEDVRRMHWTTASRLCAAVIEFARTCKGPVHRTSAHDPHRLQLVVPGAIAYLFLEIDLGIVRVQRMFAR